MLTDVDGVMKHAAIGSLSAAEDVIGATAGTRISAT